MHGWVDKNFEFPYCCFRKLRLLMDGGQAEPTEGCSCIDTSLEIPWLTSVLYIYMRGVLWSDHRDKRVKEKE